MRESAAQHAPEPSADDSVWRELESVLDELADAARKGGSSESFYATLVQKLSVALAAEGGAAWQCNNAGNMRLVTATESWKEQSTDRAAHESMLDDVASSGETIVVVAEEPSHSDSTANGKIHRAVGVVTLRDWLEGQSPVVALIELLLPVGRSPSSYEGARQLLEAVCQTAAEYHVRQQLARTRGERVERDALIDYARRIESAGPSHATLMAIANEGRRVLDCDRLSVLTTRGHTAKLAAVSGVDRVERRSRAARGLESIARIATQLGEPIYYADGQADALPQVAEAVSSYVDEFHARQLLAIPIELPRATDDTPSKPEFTGVLVAEHFAAGRTLDRDLALELAQSTGPALAHVRAWDEVPFAGALRSLSKLRGTRVWPRLAVTGALLVAAVAALTLIQVPLHLDVRGQLLPVVRQEVFAPRSAVVDQLHAEHGTDVAAGQTLVTLRDSQLAMEIERLRGEATQVERQLEAVRATRTTASSDRRDAIELYRLSAQEEELKTKFANLERERDLLGSQAESLNVTSPIAGTVTTWQVDKRLAARPVERGQVLLSVADTAGAWELELAVPDDQMDYLRQALKHDQPIEVEYRLGSDATQLHRATVTRIAERADVVSSPAGDTRRQVMVHATPTDTLSEQLRATALRPGGSVRARIVCGEHSLGYVWFGDAMRAVRNWWEF